ncbi:SH3 domain-containing protein [Nereida sp. MMG025]|uniref:SH3 domain-containing protein n=1 Tax=Nereida sp. MMG025 TaxID=2909981 RepID=UPI001F483C68|nr:SH3 domain-containing protein [Nereida sp. MMG025]MCF6445937.1 SH3 domain-containing protein [Nereida sp. MMG025]
MWRLIVVTFGFLGFSFYELSGGDEFEAQAWPEPAKTVQVTQTQPEPEPTPITLASVSTKNTNEETLSLTPLAEPEKVEEVVATPEPVVEQDIRKVTGNRVNFRNGPGTTYGVVGKLTGGTETLVLQEPGNGWVKIRTQDGKIGWIADFLLTAG